MEDKRKIIIYECEDLRQLVLDLCNFLNLTIIEVTEPSGTIYYQFEKKEE